MAEPSSNGSNGAVRASNGKFLPGNPGGPGHSPFGQRVTQFRATLIDAVTDEDLRAVVMKLVEKAKEGDSFATRELLDRLLGKPDQAHKIIAAVADGLSPQQLGELLLGSTADAPPP